MSFVVRSIRPVARSTLVSVRTQAARPLSSSAIRSKTVTETAKEKLDAVNKAVGKGFASAIETGESATQATKEAVGVGAKKAKAEGEETANVVGQKGNQAAAQAREKKDDLLEKGKSN